MAFDLIMELNESITSAIWIDNCFVYLNADLKLCYLLGKKPTVITRLQKKMVLLGYVQNLNKLFLMDKGLSIYCYDLNYNLIQYQQAVLLKNLESAQKILPLIPKELHLKVAKFLESNEYKELAYQITPEPSHKYEYFIWD